MFHRSYDGLPWEKGYIESFIGKLQDELRNHHVAIRLTHIAAGTAIYVWDSAIL
jgi:hypothetical protein